MPVFDINTIQNSLHHNARLLGLDVGSKTIGLAISDYGLSLASPLTTIRRRRFSDDAMDLRLIIGEHEIGGLIVGLPLSMDGSEGPRCQSVRQFAANLLAIVDLPLAFWDERLSTRAVERILIAEADLSRAKRRKVIDRAAAAYILQGALDALRHRRLYDDEPEWRP